MQDTSQEFELDAHRKNIDLEVEAPQDSAIVYADIGLIQRVLETCCAMRSSTRRERGRIRITVENRSAGVAVAVSDSGCGIAESDLPRIFDRFYRHERGGVNPSGSAGLGLAIVKRILDLHGSRITVTSEIDRGTRFEFDLRSEPVAA